MCGLIKPIRPVARLPASVGDGDDPNVVGPADVEEGKREVLQSELLHAWELWDGAESLGVGLDRLERGFDVLLEAFGKPIPSEFPVEVN